jgi:hypothetical protein
MRSVLGASVALGVPLRLLADCLGTRPDSVRNRAGRPAGIVTSDLILALTDLTPTELDQLSGGALSRAERTLPASFQTIDLVRALISTPFDPPT